MKVGLIPEKIDIAFRDEKKLGFSEPTGEEWGPHRFGNWTYEEEVPASHSAYTGLGRLGLVSTGSDLRARCAT